MIMEGSMQWNAVPKLSCSEIESANKTLQPFSEERNEEFVCVEVLRPSQPIRVM